MNTSRRHRPVPSAPRAAPGYGLRFCAVCQVSIASSEIESGEAHRTPRGRTFCAVCAKATPEELESEYADDAPVMVPFRRADADAAPVEPAPIPAPARSVEMEVLDRRVGELERSAFRMQARLTSIEEKLEAVLRKMG
jgi:hypothetical protein